MMNTHQTCSLCEMILGWALGLTGAAVQSPEYACTAPTRVQVYSSLTGSSYTQPLPVLCGMG